MLLMGLTNVSYTVISPAITDHTKRINSSVIGRELPPPVLSELPFLF